MTRVGVLLFCSLAGTGLRMVAQDAAQLFNQAPPQVDEALRARIKIFYQAHVDGKFRLADEVVAEDSKDIFFEMQKPRYKGFDIVKINYSDNFTKADAVVACQGEWMLQGRMMPVTMPLNSSWKFDKGEWWWYVKPSNGELKTPFGTMHFDEGKTPGGMPAIPKDPQAAAQEILHKVQVDKTEVMLSSYKPASQDVLIKNGMPGSVTLRVTPDTTFKGFSYTLDKANLNAGETAKLTLRCDPADKTAKPTLKLRIFVEPISQQIPITVKFAIPPDIEKMIPKEARTATPAK